MKRIHIVAAIIFNQDRSQIFITKRPDDKHKGGFWEFPGGKVEQNETVEQAMIRELEEEIGITVTEQALFEHLEYDYPDKSLKFDFMTVSQFNNQPYGREGQEGRWVDIIALPNYAFPEANVPILERVVKEFS
ncbi:MULTISPECIES: 8-oxo-dGTP diphosphatase MutT [Gammaproteobacteria]|jgi:8-oxo-dGTP diphosphatase|uniref:8-oxo-dGTP diphosphatase n=1 Tax=Vibrio jasicida TaxID=766224 RepID=A0AAU9QEZ4_9VIBR|nr:MULTISPECIES: 8-oxo-dGTP diphosphatase MutT [Vibrio]KIP72696.1 7,8-dihydro-8-oxoguanine-triphosphatase [Vibrio harveyi]NOJ16211.1 8-oxo-dGTP diphosphatase MutT [Vibrio jasicida]UQA49341.1 8-oxo-dGTP diphosphatase MutT [Vibrio sp. ED002]CAH1559923.1 8-oxo-dGTP diphosphatase [Vibrio jasicida]CAH1568670.1 8-oxo-dGTP diphosphatase [Vibrio jasicida]